MEEPWLRAHQLDKHLKGLMGRDLLVPIQFPDECQHHCRDKVLEALMVRAFSLR
jgi:hypothetical protein